MDKEKTKVNKKDALRLSFYIFENWVDSDSIDDLKTFWKNASTFLEEMHRQDNDEVYESFEEFESDWDFLTRGIMITGKDKLKEAYNRCKK
jgi:hypothetical protein